MIKIGDYMNEENSMENLISELNMAILESKQLSDTFSALKLQIDLQNKIINKYNKPSDNKSLIEIMLVDLDKEYQKYQEYLTSVSQNVDQDQISKILSEIDIFSERISLKISELKNVINFNDNVWYDIASVVFNNRVDLSLYTNHQLCCYLCAIENGSSVDDIIYMMNPERDINHLEQLFFIETDEKNIQYLIDHPSHKI